MEITRVFDLLEKVAKKNAPDSLAAKVNKEWKKISGKEFKEKAYQTSAALLDLGLHPVIRLLSLLTIALSGILLILAVS